MLGNPGLGSNVSPTTECLTICCIEFVQTSAGLLPVKAPFPRQLEKVFPLVRLGFGNHPWSCFSGHSAGVLLYQRLNAAMSAQTLPLIR